MQEQDAPHCALHRLLKGTYLQRVAPSEAQSVVKTPANGFIALDDQTQRADFLVTTALPMTAPRAASLVTVDSTYRASKE
jgi:hypothetical protein